MICRATAQAACSIASIPVIMPSGDVESSVLQEASQLQEVPCTAGATPQAVCTTGSLQGAL